MRLNDPIPHSLSRSGEPRITHAVRGPGLWALFYAAFWLNASLLAALIAWAVNGRGLWAMAGWAIGLGIVVLIAGLARVELHDAMVGFDDRERLGTGLLVFLFLFAPALVRGVRIVPHGLLWATPLMILLSVTPSLARRTLTCLLLGAWGAAAYVHDGFALGLLLAFAISWLLALGATHYAFTGDPHGLQGWWPVRQVLYNALMTSIPASLAGGVGWWLWPAKKAAPPPPLTSTQGVASQPRILDRVDPMQMLDLLWRGSLALVLIFLTFILLHYLRRFFFKWHALTIQPDLIPGQVARIEYLEQAVDSPNPTLPGRRGKIVALWRHWAASLAAEGLARQPGETADHYAQRLTREAPETAPPAAMTELLDRSHYGAQEPSPADLETMRQYVQEEMSRLSLTRQKPMDALEDPGSER